MTVQVPDQVDGGDRGKGRGERGQKHLDSVCFPIPHRKVWYVYTKQETLKEMGVIIWYSCGYVLKGLHIRQITASVYSNPLIEGRQDLP